MGRSSLAAAAQAKAKARVHKQKKPKAKATAQAKGKPVGTVTHNDQKNFCTAGKNATSQQKKDCYNHYMSLDRFDSEKKTLLEMFKKDKSCRWFYTYVKSKGQSTAIGSDGLKSYGTE